MSMTRIGDFIPPFIFEPNPVSSGSKKCKYSTSKNKCIKKLGRCDGYKRTCKKKSTNKF